MVKKIIKKEKLSKSKNDEFKIASKEIKKELNLDDNKNIKISVSNESDTIGNIYKQRDKKNNEKVNDFAAFYKGSKNKNEDMSKIERKDPNRKKKTIWWVILILVVVLAATLFGFYYFINQEDKFSGDNLDVEIKTPLLVSAGDGIEISITIYNRADVDIAASELILQLPEDYIFNSSSPLANNEANNAWTIGQIKSGSSETVTIYGKMFGELNKNQSFSWLLNYTPANFSSQFQKSDQFDIAINDSVFDLNFTVPSKVVSGYASNYSFEIANKSSDDMINVRLSMNLPVDMTVDSYDPEPSNEPTIWDIELLKSGESYEVSFDAVLDAEEGDMREIDLQIGYLDDQRKFNIQKEESAIVFVVNPQLLLTMSVNASAEGFPVSSGDTLKYILNYENNSQSEVKDLLITAEIDGSMLDWDSLTDVNGGVISNGAIAWDQDSIEDLASVKPGDEGEIAFSINLQNTLEVDSEEDVNFLITSNASAISNNVVDFDDGTLEVESNEVVNKINSQLILRAEGRYYDDEYIKVGLGSIPPQVGSETRYRIYWYVRNGANEVSPVVVSATLPTGVVWESNSKISAGNISYDPNTRKISWSINKVPEHVGQYLSEIWASFDVSITPTTDDIGNILILLDKSEIVSTDSFTEQEISISEDMITSALPDDPQAIGQGEVVAGTSTNTNTIINSNSNTNSTANVNSL
ncbi:MAG: hypothetical protein ACNFW9_03690 [Candidatus Kerfeldbacteria bacterium]|jgi:hypothetical protein